MTETRRHHYVVELDGPKGADPWLDFEVSLRTPSRTDIEELAELMLEAYLGTIDYEGETVEEARQEVTSYFDGSPLLDSSYVATVDEGMAGAILLSEWRDEPLVGYVMTRPEYKNQGLGSLLLRASLATLRQAGEERVHAFITEGNIASEALFRGVGAELVSTTAG